MELLMPRKKSDKPVKPVDYCAVKQGIVFPPEERVGKRHPMPTQSRLIDALQFVTFDPDSERAFYAFDGNNKASIVRMAEKDPLNPF